MRVGDQRRWPGRLGIHVVGLVVLAGCLIVGGCKGGETPDAKQEPAKKTAASVLQDVGEQTDNSACMVCHMDFADEPLAADHLEAGIVCSACHGASEAHGGDELNITTPDVLYGRAEIEPFCKACHPVHVASEDYDAFVKKWRGQRRPNGRMILEDSVCTDCHGNHAIQGS